MVAATKTHKFADLGEYPYALIGYEYDPPVQDYNGSWSGGQHDCDHCGRPISHVFICRSSDGKVFNLGSQHVEELGDEGLTSAVKLRMAEVRREARHIKELERWEAERPAREAAQAAAEADRKAQAEALAARYESAKARLAARPHPFGFRGKTLLDYIEYCGGVRWYRVERYLDEVGA